MSVTCKTKGFSDLRSRILTAPRTMRQELEDPVRVEARGFLTDIVKVTPPSSKGVTGKAAQRQGQAKVRGDIAKVYTTEGHQYGKIKDPNIKRAWYKAVKSGDAAEAQRLSAHLGTEIDIPVGTFDGGSRHERRRSKRDGNVHGETPELVVTNPRDLARYVKDRVSHVLLLASGFNGAAAELAAKIPVSIQKHGILASGGIQVIIRPTDFLIIIRNTAPWAGAQDMQRRMSKVHKYRARGLQKKLEVIMAKQSRRIVGR